MVRKKTLAVIPARGGSKRIPKKNIIDFFGKPMIAWTIEAAMETGIFDRVIVSTDDSEIASVAKLYGAEVPFLRDKYFDDHSPVSLATITALNQLHHYEKETFETVVQLLPNCPLRTSKYITEAYEHFLKSGASFQISCFKFGWMNPWWAFKLDEQSRPIPLFPDKINKRSQDLPELFCPTGAVWIADVKALLAEGTFYGTGYQFYCMDWRAAIDIDDLDDLKIARALYLMDKLDDVEVIKE